MKRRLAISGILLAGLVTATAAAQTKIVAEKLAEGVWAAPTPEGANVGWFTLGDSVVAVDSGLNAEVGRALVEEIRKTTGQKPRYLLVTHAHRDHAGGASAFASAGAQVVAAEKATSGVLAVLEAASHGAAAAGKAGPPKSAGSPYVLTLAERALFVGSQPRRAEIYYLGPGHTQGDLVVVLPAEGVLFAGDLAVNGVLPFVRATDVDPKGWERILTRLAALKIEKMVPGHGKIGPRDGIADTAAYLRRVDEIATRLLLTNPPDSLFETQVGAPENLIENVKITPDHVANVKAVYLLAKAERDKAVPAPTPTPLPR